MKTGKFRLTGKKALLKNSDYPAVVALDVTETAIERPKKNRKDIIQARRNVIPSKLNWSLIKRQEQLFALLLGKDIATILACLKKVKFLHHPETDSLQDSGYQGIKDYHLNSYIPRKKPKNGKLSLLEKEYNRTLAQERIV